MSESDNEARVVAERLQIMAQGYLDMTDRAEKAERLLDEALCERDEATDRLDAMLSMCREALDNVLCEEPGLAQWHLEQAIRIGEEGDRDE